MATVNLSIKSAKNPANLYVRFTNTRSMDFERPLGIFVNPSTWDKERQKIRNVIEVINRDEINSNLAKLKINIIDLFNLDFMNGELINGKWLEGAIQKSLHRPKGEVKLKNPDENIYWSNFARTWMKDTSPTWKVKSGQYMGATTKRQYDVFIGVVERFEKNSLKAKIKFKEIDSILLDRFAAFLAVEKYTPITADRFIKRFKFFCRRAEAMNLEINKNFQEKVFIEEEKIKYKYPYCNEHEIELIFKETYPLNSTIDCVRDNRVIGLWTGLRVGDFLTRLDVKDFNNGFIDVVTEKTKTPVSIPIHEHIKAVLEKRNGALPPKISEQKFNQYIKIIAKDVGMNQEMTGGIAVKDKATKNKRKVVSQYQKHLLVSSHICRRSFATNLYGEVPNHVIMDICGWSSEKQMLHYIQETNRESAMIVKNHWVKKNIVKSIAIN